MYDQDGSETGLDNAALQAEKIYRIMLDRNDLIGKQIFSDPAWSILLDLFISYKANRRSSVSDVCVGSRSPQATCLRYISVLSDANLICRERDVHDKRRVFISLTPKAIALMVELLDKQPNRLREFAVAFDHTEADPTASLDLPVLPI